MPTITRPHKKLINFNPFAVAYYKGTLAPHSRALHMSLLQKLVVTFKVLSGSTNALDFYQTLRQEKKLPFCPPSEKKTHFGLFDFITLGLAWLLHLAGGFCFSKIWCPEKIKNSSSKALFALGLLGILPILILDIIVNTVIRYVFSSVLTLALAPLVMIAAGLCKMVAFKKERKLFALLKDREVFSNPCVQSSDKQLLSPGGKLLDVLGNKSLCTIQVGSVAKEGDQVRMEFYVKKKRRKTDNYCSSNHHLLFFSHTKDEALLKNLTKINATAHSAVSRAQLFPVRPDHVRA